MKKAVTILTGSLALLTACNSAGTLEGKWEYAGGVYNGKKEGSTDGYKLKRTYSAQSFEAFMIEEGGEPQKYQAGDYTLKADSCFETETFSTQPSKLTGVAVHYNYHLKNDTLILKGKLPTGMQVEEYWTREK